mmetsp:Transcript_503/g.1283  ORF Transcript_503/g.1283 Transcript_503/m.1283 type:complete len:216 (-) Transcript_503:1038-1685(-)
MPPRGDEVLAHLGLADPLPRLPPYMCEKLLRLRLSTNVVLICHLHVCLQLHRNTTLVFLPRPPKPLQVLDRVSPNCTLDNPREIHPLAEQRARSLHRAEPRITAQNAPTPKQSLSEAHGSRRSLLPLVVPLFTLHSLSTLLNLDPEEDACVRARNVLQLDAHPARLPLDLLHVRHAPRFAWVSRPLALPCDHALVATHLPRGPKHSSHVVVEGLE